MDETALHGGFGLVTCSGCFAHAQFSCVFVCFTNPGSFVTSFVMGWECFHDVLGVSGGSSCHLFVPRRPRFLGVRRVLRVTELA